MKLDLDEDLKNYMYNFVERIVHEVGPRMPCSSEEAKTAEIIEEELEKSCDSTTLEGFKCHPKAFLGWIKLDVIMVFSSIILYFLLNLVSNPVWKIIIAIISFLLVFLPLIIIWEEFFNYKEFIDPLFKEKESQNTIGTFSAKGERKRIIIFSSHMDTALQFNLLKILKWGFLVLAFLGIICMLIWFIVSFINLFFVILGLFSLPAIFFDFTLTMFIIAIPCFTGLFFFVPLGDKGNVVPGAVDNLSSCSVILGLGKYINQNKQIIPNNTEIRLISFGCEEAGLRGSYRYVDSHREELNSHDTMVINMDGLETPDGFHAIDYEPTTRTKHSDEVIEKLIKAAKDVNISIKRFGSGKLEKTVGRLSGGSDAAAFSRADIMAGFLNSADWKARSNYYHQSTDTPDKIKKGTLENALKICIAFLKNEQKNNQI